MKGINAIKTGFNKIDVKAKAAKAKALAKQGVNKFNALDKKKKIIIGSSTAAGVIVLGSLCFALGGSNSATTEHHYTLGQNGMLTQNHPVNPVLTKLGSIEDQIQRLQSQQNTTGVSQQQIESLNSNLASLRQVVASLQQSSPQGISEIKSVVATGNQSINGQLTQIKQTVEQIKKQEEPKHYLPASALPWAIDGVDVRNYQPVVIRANGYGAINKGEVRDGWKLVQVQFNPPLAVFQNVRNPSEYVKVQQ